MRTLSRRMREVMARTLADRLFARAPYLVPVARRYERRVWVSLVGAAGTVVVELDGKFNTRLVDGHIQPLVHAVIAEMDSRPTA